MRRTGIFILTITLFLVSCNTNQQSANQSGTENMEEDLVQVAKDALEFAQVQYTHATNEHTDVNTYPRSLNEDGSVRAVKPRDWTSGFYAGVLWYLYDYTGEEKWREQAEKWTNSLEEIKNYDGTHDLGFMIFCSFGNGYRLTGNEHYKEVILTGSETLSTRFNPNVGCIKSWDHGDWKFPVIIDNMMNLEMLYWTSKNSDEDKFYNLSLTHADTTMKNHYRPDYSSYHVVDYDPETGEVIEKVTHQGYADESAWARGQSWGLYGYVMSYRETGEQRYLDHAINIADFLLSKLPQDYVPYWDYDEPGIPDVPRDASAAAIMCSALLELSQLPEVPNSSEYMEAAENMIRKLASPEYTAAEGENGNFILMHSVGHKPKESEVDVPLIYADYYYVESLLRYLEINNAI